MTSKVGSLVWTLGCLAIACGGDGAPVEAGSAAHSGDGAGGLHASGGATPAGAGGVATGGASTAGAAGPSTPGGASGGAVTSSGGSSTGGGEPGGEADCFADIPDFTVRDGGLGAAPREVVEIADGESVSIFRPSDASFGRSGCRYPLLVWGNGSTNTIDIWAGHLSRAASFGFIVVGPEQTQVSAAHMNAALDYVVGLSEDPDSNYYHKVDTAKLGASGYSLGGAGAMQVASNPRIGATFVWDTFGNCSALHGPMGTIVASDGLGGLDIVDDCPAPAFGMEASGTTHTSILGFPGGLGGAGRQTPYAQEGYVAWFRWQFMGDAAAEALFAGTSCGFCTREGITVRQNGI